MSTISPGEAQRPGRPPLLGGIEALFSAYAKALDDEDAGALAACFATPITIWHEGRASAYANRDVLANHLSTLIRANEKAKIERSRWVPLDWIISGHTAFVAIGWRQERGGRFIVESVCRYALRFDEGPGRWAIAFVINEDLREP